ncbi:MAG TPA: potassium transporter TrkG [Candidatus Competibacteraceae bacterium]|nr:TrkH family potassium uptake protein [Candidatus Competibacteraceae bacterium]MCP5134405.1 TrkH family potassium uptake protein [Gammaproteobacteria bacterium]HPF57813.1 potassium transporter TrkG [Candidatus Competibacteraceae bacterium]HRY17383.1 potassium transporter TrkG [Candidatus Competibacteraceae bacterium]
MTGQSVRLLAAAVRPRVILKYLGVLLLSTVAIAAVPALAAFFYDDSKSALRFAAMAAMLFIVGRGLARIHAPPRIQLNEALAITALAFLAAALAMIWPLMAEGLSFIDALFEAVSAVTTTGLSTLATVEDRSQAFLFARAWLQWYGGLAITVLALAFILTPGAATRRLAGSEADAAELVMGTRWRARHVLAVYVVLTIGGIVLLWIAGARGFDAVIHTLTAISTGGFAGYDRLDHLGAWPVLTGLMVIMLSGAISFSLQFRSWVKGLRVLRTDPELHALLLAGLITFLALAACFAFSKGGIPDKDGWANAAFLAVSAQTTTGFAMTPVAELPDAVQLVLIVSMSIGGDMGSTAGGVKILRLLILLRLVQLLLARVMVPRHAVLDLQIGNRRLDAREIEAAVGVAAAFSLAALLSWLPFLLAGVKPLAALFEVASALATCGLSAGVAAPGLSPLLKLVLCLDMLMGRLEIIALLILVYPRTWFGRRSEPL